MRDPLGRLRDVGTQLSTMPKRLMAGGVALVFVIWSAFLGAWGWVLLLLCIVCLIAGIYWLIGFAARARKRFLEDRFSPSHADNVTDDFKSDWKKALAELRSTGARSDDLGFYVLIGEPGSGKTTSLKKSGLGIAGEIEGSGGTKNCRWFFTDDAIVLDTAGRLSFHEEVEADAESWKLFLKLTKQQRPQCPINGVIVAIPCDRLLNDSDEDHNRKAGIIRNALIDLGLSLEMRFPVYISLTKADQIGGFVEFFSYLSAMDQSQLLGWSRPVASFGQPYRAGEIEKPISALVQRLRQIRLGLMQGETSDKPTQFSRVFPFPEELKALQAPLDLYFEQIFPESRLVDPPFFQGFWFSSGMQEGAPVLRASARLFGGGGSAQDDLLTSLQEEKVFFIRDFYKKKVFRERGLLKPTSQRLLKLLRIRKAAYAAALLLCAVGTFLLLMNLGNIQAEADNSVEKLVEIEKGLTAQPLIYKDYHAPIDAALGIAVSGQEPGVLDKIEQDIFLSGWDYLSLSSEGQGEMKANLERAVSKAFRGFATPALNDWKKALIEFKASDFADSERFELYKKAAKDYRRFAMGKGHSLPDSLRNLEAYVKSAAGATQIGSDEGENEYYQKLNMLYQKVKTLTSQDSSNGSAQSKSGVYSPAQNPMLHGGIPLVAKEDWEAVAKHYNAQCGKLLAGDSGLTKTMIWRPDDQPLRDLFRWARIGALLKDTDENELRTANDDWSNARSGVDSPLRVLRDWRKKANAAFKELDSLLSPPISKAKTVDLVAPLLDFYTSRASAPMENSQSEDKHQRELIAILGGALKARIFAARKFNQTEDDRPQLSLGQDLQRTKEGIRKLAGLEALIYLDALQSGTMETEGRRAKKPSLPFVSDGETRTKHARIRLTRDGLDNSHWWKKSLIANNEEAGGSVFAKLAKQISEESRVVQASLLERALDISGKLASEAARSQLKALYLIERPNVGGAFVSPYKFDSPHRYEQQFGDYNTLLAWVGSHRTSSLNERLRKSIQNHANSFAKAWREYWLYEKNKTRYSEVIKVKNTRGLGACKALIEGTLWTHEVMKAQEAELIEFAKARKSWFECQLSDMEAGGSSRRYANGRAGFWPVIRTTQSPPKEVYQNDPLALDRLLTKWRWLCSEKKISLSLDSHDWTRRDNISQWSVKKFDLWRSLSAGEGRVPWVPILTELRVIGERFRELREESLAVTAENLWGKLKDDWDSARMNVKGGAVGRERVESLFGPKGHVQNLVKLQEDINQMHDLARLKQVLSAEVLGELEILVSWSKLLYPPNLSKNIPGYKLKLSLPVHQLIGIPRLHQVKVENHAGNVDSSSVRLLTGRSAIDEASLDWIMPSEQGYLEISLLDGKANPVSAWFDNKGAITKLRFDGAWSFFRRLYRKIPESSQPRGTFELSFDVWFTKNGAKPLNKTELKLIVSFPEYAVVPKKAPAVSSWQSLGK